MITRLIIKVEEIKADIIGNYNRVIITIDNPLNFKFNKNLELAFDSLSEQGKNYSMVEGKTNRGLVYLDFNRR